MTDLRRQRRGKLWTKSHRPNQTHRRLMASHRGNHIRPTNQTAASIRLFRIVHLIIELSTWNWLDSFSDISFCSLSYSARVFYCYLTGIYGSSHPRPFIWWNPFRQHGMRAWYNRTFAQTLNETNDAQPKDATLTSSYRHQEREYWIEQHSPAEESQRTIAFGQHAKWNLCQHITIEEWWQNNRLNARCPREFTILRRMILQGNKNRGKVINRRKTKLI